jgi:hypothetical protein
MHAHGSGLRGSLGQQRVPGVFERFGFLHVQDPFDRRQGGVCQLLSKIEQR